MRLPHLRKKHPEKFHPSSRNFWLAAQRIHPRQRIDYQGGDMSRTIVLFAGLLFAFALGAVSGYAAKTVTTPAAPVAQHAAACPQGTHAVVWYTAKTWACASNQ